MVGKGAASGRAYKEPGVRWLLRDSIVMGLVMFKAVLW